MIKKYLRLKQCLFKKATNFCTNPLQPPQSVSELTDQEKREFKESVLGLDINRTSFNPRFNALVQEKKYLSAISTSLYNWQKNQDRSQTFRILDSPIPINGELHLGHFFNRTLKDIINRYKMLKGFEIDFVIGKFCNLIKKGFQCSGYEVQNEALAEKRLQDEDEQNFLEFNLSSYKDKFTQNELRLITNTYIQKQIKEYLIKQHRWGLLTDQRSVYSTMCKFFS